MKKENKIPDWLKSLGRYLLIAAGLALMVLVLLRLFPRLFAVLGTGDVEQIEDYLRGSDRVVCYAALMLMQFVQVASIVIPALPIRIAAGAVLDVLPGFFACWASFILANLCVFVIVRHLGGSLQNTVHRFVQESKLAAPLRKVMDTGNSGLFVVIANIVPFLPNGIIPYAVAMTDLGTAQFVVAVAIGSALPALADCALGAAILDGNLLLTVVSYGALFALAFVMYKQRRRLAAMLDGMAGK